MPHASEGNLHAYLDGALQAADPAAARSLAAHVEACADCRARLEAARGVRDRSAELLEVALGDALEPPGFDAVLREAEARRRGGGGGGTASRARTLQRLAWAASIVVALGAGWIGRAVLGDRDPAAPAESAFGPPAAALEERAEDRLENEARLDRIAPADAPAATDPDVVGEVATEGGRAAPTERADDARVAQNEPVAEPPAALAQVTARERVGPESAGALADAGPPERAGERQEAPAPGRALAEQAEASKAAGEDVAMEVEGAADLAEADRFDQAAWTATAEEEATAFVGAALRRVPELDVLEVAVAELDGLRFARVRQRLPGGETLEIFQQGPVQTELRSQFRAAAPGGGSRDEARADAPAAEEAETLGRPSVLISEWVESEGVRIRIAAPVASDSLQALLSRVR